MNLQKGRSGDDGPAASSMIKSEIWRGRRRRLRQLELHTFPSWGVFLFYTRISP